MGIAGLNPHTGEGGFIGEKEIIPVIEEARELAINVERPFPADTIFCRVKGGMFDIVVVMYHDQGAYAIKIRRFYL